MVVSRSRVRTDEQLAERRLAKNSTKGRDCLLQNLTAMSNEKQTCLTLPLQEKPAEVESSYDSFAGAGRRDDEISVVPVGRPFRLQSV